MAIIKYNGNCGAVYYNLLTRRGRRVLYKHLEKLSYPEKWNLRSCLLSNNQKREQTILHASTGKLLEHKNK